MKILWIMLAAVCFMGCTVEPVEGVQYPPGYYGGIYYARGYYRRPIFIEHEHFNPPPHVEYRGSRGGRYHK